MVRSIVSVVEGRDPEARVAREEEVRLNWSGQLGPHT